MFDVIDVLSTMKKNLDVKQYKIMEIEKNEFKFLKELLEIEGAFDYSGNCSSQVVIPKKNGGFIRIGITDDDVGSGKLWFDNYEGLNNELVNIKK